jgi:hypothetical protein
VQRCRRDGRSVHPAAGDALHGVHARFPGVVVR